MTIFEFNKRFPTKKSAIDFIIRVKYNGTSAKSLIELNGMEYIGR